MPLVKMKNCKGCSNCFSERHYTDDSFELAHDYLCKHDKFDEPKMIEEYVNWNEKLGGIPKWCPILVK